MFERTVTMDHEQFMQWKYGKKNNKYDLNFVLKTGLGTAMFILSNPKIVMAATNFDSMDSLGNTFLTIIRRAGYWIIMLIALVHVLKEITKGKKFEDVIKVIIGYLLLYACLFAIPMLFDMIKEAF